MNTIQRIGIVMVLICLIVIPVQAQIEKHEALAAKLVSQCANIDEGDRVLITGSIRDADLMNAIYLQTRKVGAFAMIGLQNQLRDRLFWDVVPEKFDDKENTFNKKLTGIVDAQISVSYGEALGLFRDVPIERMRTRAKANQAITELFQERGVRLVTLGNGLYPTEPLAEQFGISKEQLAEQFWNGVNTDYDKLQKVGKSIKSKLEKGKKLQLLGKNGTNISMSIKERSVLVSDGIISDEEAKAGHPTCQVWLPAGEVYLTPVPGTANGTIIVDHFFYQGEAIEGLKLTFKNGQLESMTAKSGLQLYKERYDEAGEGKSEFSFVDIGINPDVSLIPGSKMVAWMPSGMVTIGHGNNTWAGGDNKSLFGSAYYLTDATVKVDGKVIVKKGILK